MGWAQWASKGVDTGLSASSAYSGFMAGKTQKGEYDLEAKQIELGATQREADRKERLSRALGTMSARSSANGVSGFEGSPMAVMQEESRLADVAQERDAFMSQLQSMTAKARGRQVKSGAKAQSLLQFATDVQRIWGAS